MEQEIWKDIAGFDGLYKVSNLGRVKSLNYKRSGKEGILSPKNVGKGYSKVSLWKNGKENQLLVHRLAAQAFLLNPDNKPEVDHIDKNKCNNNISNLRWVTSKENKDNGQSKPVICVETSKVYESASEAARQTGAYNTHISDCCLNKRKTTKGFHWQYAD